MLYISYKISYHFTNPFYRTKIRIKKEIVTLGNKVNTKKNSGIYIEPEKWNELITETIVYPDVWTRISKYKTFIHFEHKVYKAKLIELCKTN